ncbi:hypothetical protein JRO89_XS04G0144500 [Xanthoceras sorbifolium]|uniref:Response regulatory domain-containing protein n=1 Tax=Xanthoceras sorbifolium TaxID=99658 RepID=A0ABQ8I5U0_9ROSI|nr:hypothetical protein JRO89_XS04G0144500 [Xanthoceras sorbifolium]
MVLEDGESASKKMKIKERTTQQITALIVDDDAIICRATKELRDMGVTSKIVGVNSCDTDAEKKAFIEAGLDFCLLKPLNEAKATPFLEEIQNNM